MARPILAAIAAVFMLAIGVFSGSGAVPNAEASNADNTIIVFVPGVCFPPCSGQNDTYYRDFDTIAQAVDAEFPTVEFRCFNYGGSNGVNCDDLRDQSTVNNVQVPYVGKSTWNSLLTSSNRLNSQLQSWRTEAQNAGNPDPRFIIVAHSLGGAVSGIWAATSSDTDLVGRTDYIVTLDSPVLGSTWASLFDGLLAGLNVPEWAFDPILEAFGAGELVEFRQSDIVADLLPTASVFSVRHGANRVNMINFADLRDLVVPFIDATLPDAFPHTEVVGLFGSTRPCDFTIPEVTIKLGFITLFHFDETLIKTHHCEVLHSSTTTDHITSLLSNPVPPINPQPPVVLPPTINVTVTPAPNAAGWNNTPVFINWSVVGADSSTGCGDQTISFQTSGSTFTCAASNPGGSASKSVTIKLDSIQPAILGSRSPNANVFGWNNSDVTVSWSCSDERSGVAFCSPSTTLANEGRNQAVAGAALDIAGNSASATVADINIDKTAPSTTHSLNPPVPNGKRNWYISDVTVTLNESDPLLSNGDQPSGIQVTRYRVNGGAWTDYTGPFVVSEESLRNVVEYYSIDRADNQQATQSFEFKLDKTPPVMTIDSGETDDIIWDQAHLEHGVLSNDPVLNIDCNATDNLDLYEVRAVDVDSGAVLDQEIVHQDPPLTQYDCHLQIPLHAGINTIDIIAEDCAGWEDAVRIQVVYVVPGPHDPRSKGFWNEAVKTKKYTNQQINTFLSYINVASDVWGNDATRNRFGPVTLGNYKTILGVPESANMEQKMKAQLLADWLNMVSGRLAVKKPVNVWPVRAWPLVMDDIGGNPLTYAYRVTLEIEEKVQPAPASQTINTVAKNLAEMINLGTIIVQ